MKDFIKKYGLYFAGGIIGAIAGYIYWATVGCENGTCPLKSSPWITITFSIIIGLFISDLINSLINKNK